MSTTMNTRAHGADQVRALERALGFEPPSPDVTRAAGADLIRGMQERVDRRRAEFVRAAELRRPVLDQLLGASGVREAMQPLQEDQKRRTARQVEVQPAWSSGVGWFDSDSGTETGTWTVAETSFKANAGHSYFCQVGFSASVDADSGTFGFADSTIHMNGYIQDMVLGGLG
ncbi:hypothetical protein [Kitasatospora mediocidica]|uniref:hypothetical protein n=1 Tax=Kitasatospora mediocidica TaxID=58352 RepID=UPI00055B361B|nr:hypothetical protein [Kitasatospora mediocidica]